MTKETWQHVFSGILLFFILFFISNSLAMENPARSTKIREITFGKIFESADAVDAARKAFQTGQLTLETRQRYQSYSTKKTLFEAAMLAQRVDLVTFLVEQGADPDMALHWAYSRDKLSEALLRTCVQKGARIYSKPSAGPGDELEEKESKRKEPDSEPTLLDEEISRTAPRTEMIEMLVRNGANSDRALAWALNQKPATKSLVQTCLEIGADIKTRDKEGNTLLHLAVSEDWKDFAAEVINKGIPVDTFNKKGITPLEQAFSTHHNLEMIDLLLKKGASFKKPDPRGETILSIELEQKRPDGKIISHLLKSGASPDRVLQWVVTKVREGYPIEEVLSNLTRTSIDAGGNLHVRSENGRVSLLPHAIRWGDTELVRSLVSKGADVNEQLPSGDTPLLKALKRAEFKPEMALLLLQKNADIRVVDAAGRKTPLILAAQQKAPDIITAILEIDSKLEASEKTIDKADSYNDTALIWAAYKDDLKTVGMLIGARADLNKINNERGSAIHYGIARRNFEMVDALVSAGTDISRFDGDGATNGILTNIRLTFDMDRRNILIHKILKFSPVTAKMFRQLATMALEDGMPSELLDLLTFYRQKDLNDRASCLQITGLPLPIQEIIRQYAFLSNQI